MASFKDRLHDGERLNLFAVGRMFHPNVVHYLGMTGEFDGFWIDGEHGGFTTREIESAVTAGLVYGLESFVRIAPTDYAVVTRCYESGAAGIMAAQVTSAAQTEEIVSWAKFHPRGRRGLNPLGHDGRFGTVPLAEFTAAANQDHFVCIQIETLGAVEEVNAIAAVDGVDMLFVGPSDLSQALGVIGDFTHPRCIEALDAVAAACATHGKRWAAVTPTPDYAEMLVGKGCTVISAVNDVKLVTAGLQSLRQTFDTIW
ncbi:MAG TPA: aldolase/citrate lyase family protein [Acidimicrobiia bacterium]|nr:aldolase/citrate lyase family protein [Acidimicrobiia bacterium]